MRREQRIGKDGEQRARSVLSGMGFEFIEKVGTPVRLVPVRVGNRRDVYQVVFGEKVAGDHRAMFPDGRSVLIEVKTIYGRNLVWSDLRKHQPAKLQEHDEWHGLSLLVWVHDSGVYVMRWPIDGFRKGKGITPETAEKHHGKTVRDIQNYLFQIAQVLPVMETA